MNLQELLSNPGIEGCHLFTLIERYEVLAASALVLAGALLGVILVLVFERAQRLQIEELQAANDGRGSRGG